MKAVSWYMEDALYQILSLSYLPEEMIADAFDEILEYFYLIIQKCKAQEVKNKLEKFVLTISLIIGFLKKTFTVAVVMAR